MTRSETYLDHGSGTPVVAPAREAMLGALEAFGDPLYIHRHGRTAQGLLDDAREEVAGAIRAQPDEIVFTSGGTESVALAISGAVRAVREIGRRIVVSAVEHPSVFGVGQALEADGFPMIRVPVDEWGRLDLEAFVDQVRRPGTLVASVQHANHEVGTIQAIAEASRLCREAGVLFHTDACQTVGRLPVDVEALGPDLLSLSGHKFGGPSGVGVLYVRRGVTLAAYPCGDDRERKRRSGMENLPGIAGLAAALRLALRDMPDHAARHWALTARLRAGIAEAVPGARIHGHPTQRVPHLVCFSVPGLDAEALMMSLDDRGYHVGGGSFCSGAPGEPSEVLEAMGHPGTPTLRVGVGRDSTEAAVDGLLQVLPGLVEQLRRVESVSIDALARFRRPPGG